MSELGCVLMDLESTELTFQEQELLQHPVCAGVILFSRNYQSPEQLKSLIQQIKKLRPNSIVATDQEGGRVQRFRAGFTVLPSMSHWGKCYDQDQQSCYEQMNKTISAMVHEIGAVGINLNLMPVLDLNHGISEVIGERSIHSDPNVVITLGELIIDQLQREGFCAVGKHFPGHGAVAADSHLSLPIDKREWSNLWDKDLRPFVNLIGKLDGIMPAHILFPMIDHRPTTFSPFWLREILRNKLGFQGLIISDDLNMNAVSSYGNFAQRAILALEAGCDLLLVCNNRLGFIEVLSALYPYDRSECAMRIKQFNNKAQHGSATTYS